MKKRILGFTLIEIMVVVTIISILAGVMYVNFNDARAGARDEVRQNTLRNMQVALELYKSQYGVYPDQGCNTSGWAGPGPSGCDEYILGLVPDFIPELPRDPIWEDEAGRGYMYRMDPSLSISAYKLLSRQTAEVDLVEDYSHDFSRCPSSTCGEPFVDTKTTYSVYSDGAEEW